MCFKILHHNEVITCSLLISYYLFFIDGFMLYKRLMLLKTCNYNQKKIELLNRMNWNKLSETRETLFSVIFLQFFECTRLSTA